MASSTLITTGVRACASSPLPSSGHQDRRKSHKSSSSSSSSANWWTPLFGWSSDPDYIDNSSKSKSDADLEARPTTTTRSTRFAPGGFTAEKAKQLRMKTMETANFHDIMYHSAIASRLASDHLSKNNEFDGL
ncbi:hypothetical protein GIB67_043143 [Kingdonia uniflora]|uniref:Uncharacterized protein n=1 Tax=Kingdonia uniflora TaxID=39325 RepID=A0A7J7NJZ5_9MAGN|nr:hypothetical protein GIB67_043143 [Kingdonia uniflora]